MKLMSIESGLGNGHFVFIAIIITTCYPGLLTSATATPHFIFARAHSKHNADLIGEIKVCKVSLVHGMR